MATLIKKDKKTVNQEELRRLMKIKQRETTNKNKVDSPFAKYNSLGSLSCTLCKVPVKTELLWQTHVLGKQHKEKVAELKNVKQNGPSPSYPNTPETPVGISAVKRKALETESDQKVKVVKSMTGGTTSTTSNILSATPKSKPISLLCADYDDDDDEDEEADKPRSNTNLPVNDVPSGLPSDFFDSSIPPAPVVSHSGSIQKADEPEKTVEKVKENTAEALPEGFFDDPVKDAKVRNVDTPKDQMDKEWDEFQKELRQVNTVSEAIVAEDDEEVRLDRQIGEIDEQIECYRRVEHLRDRQDLLKNFLKEASKAKHSDYDDYDVGEEGEDELQSLLSRDWRAKGVLI
ncbi:zinc finger protein 830 [Protopterus annectens]|uniref:zinc finger protein 830 n=1 Tax=Protopterus annectens TaxID=7888 RepID=UPI001CF955A6|nr:zinc finger protein 830 [Protopterus annectens]